MPQPMPKTMHTVTTLRADLERCGWRQGMHVLVHSSFSKVGGWVCGGAHAMILAMRDALGADGTLIMPSHSANNTDPHRWQNPPVPEEWWDTIRQEMPAYDIHTTQTRKMGILSDTLRMMQTARRSHHPTSSFTALGAQSNAITSRHDLEDAFGETSPLARLYDLDGYVCLLGVGYGNNTSLHLAEHRADFAGKRRIPQGSAMMIDGQRQWVTYTELDYDDEDFVALGNDFETQYPITQGYIGHAEVRLMRQRDLIDFGVQWMQANRHLRSDGNE